jgi:hypothetical protein
MKVPKNVMVERRAIAADLNRISVVLHKNVYDNVSQITDAKKKLDDPKEIFINPITEKRDPNIWGYEIANLSTKIPSPKHLMPKGVYDLSLQLSVSAYGKVLSKNIIEDPFIHLGVCIVIIGKKKIIDCGETAILELVSSFHLDRDKGEESSEPHPVYHFQFGGRKIRDLKKEDNSFGHLINMDIPRINHHPMDIVLAVDFALSNFKTSKWNELIQNGQYSGLVRKRQEHCLKPYFLTLSSKWDSGLNSTNWSHQALLPQLQ